MLVAWFRTRQKAVNVTTLCTSIKSVIVKELAEVKCLMGSEIVGVIEHMQ